MRKMHGINLDPEVVKQNILTELITRKDYYMQFLTGSSRSMLADALDYLHNAQYGNDVVDVIIPATSNALTVRMFIYEKNPDGFLTVQKYESDVLNCAEVHLLYTATHRKGSKGLDGHYDAIVPIVDEGVPQPFDIATPLASGSDNQSSVDYRKIHPKKLYQRTSSTSSTTSTTSSTSSSRVSSSMEGSDDSIPRVNNFREGCKYPRPSMSKRANDSADNRSSQSTSDDDGCQDADDTEDYGKAGIDMKRFIGKEAEVVSKLPWDIDGDKQYIIEYGARDKWNRRTHTGRNFRWHCSSDATQPNAIIRISRCRGGWICRRDDCTHYCSGRGRNAQRYTNSILKGYKDCWHCGHPMNRVKCKAQMMLQVQPNIRMIIAYHQDHHSCTPKYDRSVNDEYMKQQLALYPDLKPKKMVETIIESHLKDGNLEKAKEAASRLSNSKRLSQLRFENRLEHGEVGTESSSSSFQAVANLKKNTDLMDKYYIDKVYHSVDDEDESFIFKTGEVAIQIMLEMNRHSPGNSPLKKAYFFFDTMHDRVKGYKTMTGWVLNPLVRKLQRLATMDCKRENTASIITFYRNINRVMQEVSGDPNCLFNPFGWMTDEAHPNFDAIEEVYGKEAVARVVTCQWHFLKCARKAAHDRVPKEERKGFTKMCRRLITSPTIHDYHENMKAFNKLRKRCPQLDYWLKWWDARKYHIIDVFRGQVSGLNLAESGQSGLREEDIRLIDAAYHDTSSMMLQEQQYLKLDRVGKGPNLKQLQEKDFLLQKRRSDSYGRQLLANIHPRDIISAEELYEGRGFMPDRTASFKAPANPRPGNPTQARRGPAKSRQSKERAKETIHNVTGAQKRRGRGRGRVPPEQDVAIASLPMVPPSIENSYIRRRNPPVVVYIWGNVSICSGCPDGFKRSEMPPPYNMVFKMNMNRERPLFEGSKTWVRDRQKTPAYFHMFDLTCVRDCNPNLTLPDVYMNNETMKKLSNAHRDILIELGFWDHIVAKRAELANTDPELANM